MQNHLHLVVSCMYSSMLEQAAFKLFNQGLSKFWHRVMASTREP